MKEIINAFHNQRVVKIKNLNYIVNPLLDHEPETSYKLMRDVVCELSKLTDFSKTNKIIGEEDRGGYIAGLMAYHHKKSLGMVKWNPIDLKGSTSVNFRNAYTQGKMYLYGAKKGDKVILVEDLIDSGGTIISMIKLLQKNKIEICDVICIAEKEEFKGVERIRKATGINVKHLIKFNCLNKKSEVTRVYKNDNFVKINL